MATVGDCVAYDCIDNEYGVCKRDIIAIDYNGACADYDMRREDDEVE